MIVVDTNVVSELMRPEPSPAVREWVQAQSTEELYTTAITVAEIRYGIERLPDGRRKDLLAANAEEVLAAYGDYVLPFDAAAAAEYAAVVFGRERAGSPINGFDAQIAAICRTNNSPLATRNARDFDGSGVRLINPWR